jgi:hypothetical protein
VSDGGHGLAVSVVNLCGPRCPRSRSNYGWTTDDECDMFTQRMQVIQRKALAVWPPPKHLDWLGKKFAENAMLALIARESGRPHPTTEVLALNSLTDDMLPSDTVLKRGHSDCGTHVLFPTKRARRRRSVAELKEMSPFGEVWLSQELVPTLQTIGEWRVFLVHGNIIHTVHTYKANVEGGWVASQVMSFWSLKEIR